MNKEAVALAADSAVTFSFEKSEKIFSTANKIYNLSKSHPVGIMVFGNASFMGIPWETIIKLFRSDFNQNFDKLEQYANYFIKYLETKKDLIPSTVQKEYFLNDVFAFYRFILETWEQQLKKFENEKGEITEDELIEALEKTIHNQFEEWNKCDYGLNFTQEIRDLIEKNYTKDINKVIKKVFGKFKLKQEVLEKLLKIAINLPVKFPKHVESRSTSGIVISGFGNKEVFPSYVYLKTDSLIQSKLKYQKEIASINRETGGIIAPFAQREMVDTFIQGISPKFERTIDEMFSRFFSEYPKIILALIKNLEDDMKNSIGQKIEKISRDKYVIYKKDFEKFKHDRFIDPITDIVRALPKEELAAMAESLVNLTSFKRKYSKDKETVGGPIDVAVISKGDGFIWIKRKHYFKPEANINYLVRNLLDAFK